ncbi:hypothetical protein V1389_14650 [Flavobacterium rakeshii]|uniref:hypothetical protein n=1 Tax=Flavobacterium rakeshii TaxID=1038845 RepID=UPI002E7B4008|nr:hypothetical protein [Flavobacterium rakeshii]MEE1899586.1 hypothetical protein [Flavobacterium rakeshii]
MAQTKTDKDMSSEVTLTFKVKAGNPFDLTKKKKILEEFSRLPMEDQERVEQIIKSKKALQSLKDNWAYLKSLFA